MFWFKQAKTVSAPQGTECFHCGSRLRTVAPVTAAFDGTPRPFCCNGCVTVFNLMLSLGHADLYRNRDNPGIRQPTSA